MNKDTAVAQANLNRINQYTPQGSIVYNQIGTNSDGTPRYEQRQTLSADEQQKYDLNNRVALALNGLAVDNVSRVGEVQRTPFSYDGISPVVSSVGQNLPGLRTGPNGAFDTQTVNGPQGEVRDMPFGVGGPMQMGLDYSGLTKLPGTDDFSADGRRVADAVYGQATSRLDPRFNQGESDLRARLAAQGISENSDAYRRELDNFSRTKTDAYNDAAFRATQAGGAEQSRIFGLALGARQQGQNEVNTAGGFANAAQGQAFSQGAQTYAQNNAAQDQRTSQAMAIADLFNRTQGQRFSQEQAAAGFNNSARAQGFNEQSANATLNNSARQQEISERTYLRNLPLNEIAALLGTGSPVAQPNFQPVAQVGVAAPDYQGAVQNNYNAAVSQYNAQQQARSSMLGSIFGLAGSLGGAAILSDMRFKENIQRIGTLASGVGTYVFNYIGDKARQFGVMAQEVLQANPDAVVIAPDGVLYVNYGKVF